MSVLVFDAGPLYHFTLAGHLDTLHKITAHHRRVSTQAVLDELRRLEERHPALVDVRQARWLHRVATDELDVVKSIIHFAPRLGAGGATSARSPCWPGALCTRVLRSS